jgi:hypothetical protein
VCLYIRDALGLEPFGLDVPPRLINLNPVPQRLTDLSERSDLSLAWLVWWRRLIRVTSALQLGHGTRTQRDERLGAHTSAIQSIFDPFEEFESLKDSPSLRIAAQNLWKQGVKWTRVSVRPSSLHGSLVPKAVAELVIEEHHVSPEFVRAAVLVLDVKGRWSHLTQPRVLLCSREALIDDVFFATKLKETFESGLGEDAE